jgi:hypothetical protein
VQCTEFLADSIVDEPIILDGDDRLKDGDDNLNTKPAPRTLYSEQLSRVAPNLETPPILPNRTANERDNDHGISND